MPSLVAPLLRRCCRRRRGLLGWIALAVIGLPTLVRGQRLTGAVRDSTDGRPLPGVVVMVVDSQGVATTKTLTNSQGVFSVFATPDARTIQVRSIGFVPITLALSDSVRRGPTIRIGIQRVPQALAPIFVGAGCPSGATTAQALSFWEQARTGFLATLIARNATRADLNMLRYERILDPKRDTVVRTLVTMHRDSSPTPFVAGRSVDQLLAKGYIDDLISGRVYFGPDVDVLLDPAFEATHCFSMAAADRAHSGQIGVAFQPAAERDMFADVAGVLWLDRSPLGLRSLDFRYAGIEPAVQLSRGGGHLTFRTASNGIVVVDDWNLRLVGVVITQLPEDSVPYARRAVRVFDVREIGATLVSATWPDGAQLARALPTVTGMVTEATPRHGLARVMIEIPGTPYRAVTDSGGRFHMDNVLPGTYSVIATDSIGTTGAAALRTGVRRQTIRIRVDSLRGASVAFSLRPRS